MDEHASTLGITVPTTPSSSSRNTFRARGEEEKLPVGPWCTRCQSSGHLAPQCTGAAKDGPSCFKCHQQGHWAFSCPVGGRQPPPQAAAACDFCGRAPDPNHVECQGCGRPILANGRSGLKRKLPSFKLYGILGLEKAALSQEIKTAYRKLAIQHHPDKGGDPEKFIEIHDAVEVLSDETMRSKYDNLGDDALDFLKGKFCGNTGHAGWGGGIHCCFKCKQPGHWARDCPELISSGGGDKGLCFKCKKPGHWARDCPGLAAPQRAEKSTTPTSPAKKVGKWQVESEGNWSNCDDPALRTHCDSKLCATFEASGFRYLLELGRGMRQELATGQFGQLRLIQAKVLGA